MLKIQPLRPPLPKWESNGVGENDLPDAEDHDLVGVKGALSDLVQVDDEEVLRVRVTGVKVVPDEESI